MENVITYKKEGRLNALNNAISKIISGNSIFVNATEPDVKAILESLTKGEEDTKLETFSKLLNEFDFELVKPLVLLKKLNLFLTPENIIKLDYEVKKRLATGLEIENMDIDTIDILILDKIKELEEYKVYHGPYDSFNIDGSESVGLGDWYDGCHEYNIEMAKQEPLMKYGYYEDYDKFIKYAIDKDGNCLYSSIAGHLNAIGYENKLWDQCDVRRIIYEEGIELLNVIKDKDIQNANLNDLTQDYLDNIVLSGCTEAAPEYGSSIDVLLFSMKTKINVKIIESDVSLFGFSGKGLYYGATIDELRNGIDLESNSNSNGFVNYSRDPINIVQPLYLLVDVRNQHYDLLILKEGKNDSDGLIIGFENRKYINNPLHNYIPFRYINKDFIKRTIYEQYMIYLETKSLLVKEDQTLKKALELEERRLAQYKKQMLERKERERQKMAEEAARIRDRKPDEEKDEMSSELEKEQDFRERKIKVKELIESRPIVKHRDLLPNGDFFSNNRQEEIVKSIIRCISV